MFEILLTHRILLDCVAHCCALAAVGSMCTRLRAGLCDLDSQSCRHESLLLHRLLISYNGWRSIASC